MTKPPALIVMTVFAVTGILLTGCVQLDEAARPSASPSASASSPSPSPSSINAPVSSGEAWVQANKTIAAFTSIQYEIEHDGGVNVDRINQVANAEAVIEMKEIATDLQSQGLTIIGGAPTWQPNAASSSFGTLIEDSGEQIANGIVYARGCWDLTKQSSVVATGSPPPDRSLKVFPIQFNVSYLPEEHVWKVTKQTNITGQPEAPRC